MNTNEPLSLVVLTALAKLGRLLEDQFPARTDDFLYCRKWKSDRAFFLQW